MADGHCPSTSGDNICPENLLSEKTLAMLETVSAGEVWEDMKDDCRTMRRVVEHELFRVTERGFHLRRDGTPCCTLTLQRYRVHDAGRRMKTEVPPPCPARGVERKSGKIRFYFRKYFVHIDVPDTLPQYPEVREFVNISRCSRRRIENCWRKRNAMKRKACWSG